MLMLEYECSLCDTVWFDEWDCEVEDDCPTCGAVSEPASVVTMGDE